MLFASPGVAGEERYRVEILVFSQLQHEAVPSQTEWVRDFLAALDFLKPEEDDEDENNEEAESEDETGQVGDGDSEQQIFDESVVDESGETESPPGPEVDMELLPGEDLPEDPWADVVAVENMSDVMAEAWRRLRLSAPYKPEQHLSWEQSADGPFPSLRLHDLEVIQIDDPYADLRAAEALALEEDEKPLVFNDQDNFLPEDAEAESEEEPELPDPILFYRLDGTVMLRRTRFLHLDLDLELREAVYDEQPPGPAPSPGAESEPAELALPRPSSFLVHTLKQSRQVRSERMEYFDSPVLGVLAWITSFEIEDEPENEAAVEAFDESD